jgi:hypothetical protein
METSYSPRRKITTTQIVLAVVTAYILYFVFATIYRVSEACSYQSPHSKQAVEDVIDTLQSGDILLCRDHRVKLLRKIFTSSNFTHIGMIHRDLKTNQVYSFELHQTILYLPIRERIHLYQHHDGDISVRRLNRPMPMEIQEAFQKLVETTVANPHDQTPYDAILPCLTKRAFRVNVQQMKKNLCTDFVVNCLQKVGFHHDVFAGCYEPNYFQATKENPIDNINRHILDGYRYEDFETVFDKVSIPGKTYPVYEGKWK